MPKQPAFPSLRDAMKKKVTRREQFLAEMDAVVPCGGSLGSFSETDRAALPEGWFERWAPTNAVGDDAADILPSKLVCAERPDG